MNQTKVNKAPYESFLIILAISYPLMVSSITVSIIVFPLKKYLDRLPSFHDLDLFTLNSLLGKKSNDLGPILQPLGVNITLHTALPN